MWMPYNIIILKLLADHLYMFWCPDCLLLFQSDDDISFKEISIVKVENRDFDHAFASDSDC